MLITKFWEIVEKNCIEFVDVDYHKNKRYTDEQLVILGNHYTALYDEFYSLRSNKSGEYIMRKNIELSRISYLLNRLYELENRAILLAELILNIELVDFCNRRTRELIADFKLLYPKVAINMFDNPRDVLDIVQKVIKSQTNIYDEKVGVKEKNVEKQKQTIYHVVSRMSKNLGISLNINTMTCMEFIANEDVLNDLSKENQKITKTK